MKKMLALLLAFILALPLVASSESATAALQEMYAQAELLMVQGDYAGAAAKFEALGAYSDASQMTMYCKAIAAAETLGLYSMAVDAFNDLGDFKDSKQMATYYQGRAYEAACIIDVTTASDSYLYEALWHFEKAEKIYGGLAFFKDSLTRMGACDKKIEEIKNEQSQRTDAAYQNALALEQSGTYAEAIELYQSVSDYKDSAARLPRLFYLYAEKLLADENWDAASEAFQKAGNYSDAAMRVNEPFLARDYKKANELAVAGNYGNAFSLFLDLKNYKDSKLQAKNLGEKHWREIIANANVGDFIPFGTYEQDNDMNNGAEPILWQIIDKQGSSILVISRYVLDTLAWCTKEDEAVVRLDLTWADTTLRKWLNGTFYNEAFSDTEKKAIVNLTISTECQGTRHKYLFTVQGGTSIFVLSSEEAKRYLNNTNMKGIATEYAATKVVHPVTYWMRENRLESGRAMTSTAKEQMMSDSSIGVRPVLAIDLVQEAKMSQPLPYEVGTSFMIDGKRATIIRIGWLTQPTTWGSPISDVTTYVHYTLNSEKEGTWHAMPLTKPLDIVEHDAEPTTDNPR